MAVTVERASELLVYRVTGVPTFGATKSAQCPDKIAFKKYMFVKMRRNRDYGLWERMY
jgi:hypothetical protein